MLDPDDYIDLDDDGFGTTDTEGLFSSFKRAVSAVAKPVSSVVKTVAKPVASVATHIVSAPSQVLSKVPIAGSALNAVNTVMNAPTDLARRVVSGQRIDNAVIGTFKNQLAATRELAPYAQTVVSLVPGVGQGISGAMAAGFVLAEGRSLNEAAVAAIKASIPGGPLAQAAFSAVEAAASGKPIDQIALNALPVSPQTKQAIATVLLSAKALADGKTVSMVAADAAMAQIPEQYRKAAQIGVAVARGKKIQAKQLLGAAASVANPALKKALPKMASPKFTSMAMQRRIGDAMNILPSPARRAPLQLQNSSQRLVQSALQRNPALRSLPAADVANRLGVRPATVTSVSRGMKSLPFRGLSGNAAKWIRRFAPLSSGSALLDDVRGLIEGGSKYVVENGDFPGKIAQKLTGKASNWPKLIRANPQKATVDKGIGPEFKTLFAGEKLNLPAEWVKATPTVPVSATDSATVLQAKAILAAWGKTDGVNMAGVTDYGSRPEDLAPNWSSRDGLMLKSFSQWYNVNKKASLSTDGNLTPSHSAALRTWAEGRASSTVPTTPTTGPVATPVPNPIPGLPPVVVAMPAPSPSGDGSVPTLPSVGWPTIPGVTPAPTQSTNKKEQGSAFLPIAAGVGAGYTVGGGMGAIVGGILGAILGSSGSQPA